MPLGKNQRSSAAPEDLKREFWPPLSESVGGRKRRQQFCGGILSPACWQGSYGDLEESKQHFA